LTPANISISARSPGSILLPIVGLPFNSNGIQIEFECLFGQTGLRSRARLRPDGVDCEFPKERLGMGMAPRQEEKSMRIALRATGTQIDLAKFEGKEALTIYSCDAHKL
jgi:hypothetical protein